MRRLAARLAQRCEDATGRFCRCRCNGACHGLKRGEVERLPHGDPHHVIRKQRWRQLALPFPD